MKQNLPYHLVAAVLTGLAVSLLFYVSFGAFVVAGSLGWSIVATVGVGAIGGLAGGLWLRNIGGTIGITMFLQVVVFALASGLFVA